MHGFLPPLFSPVSHHKDNNIVAIICEYRGHMRNSLIQWIGSQVGLVDEKNQGSKISSNCPFKNNNVDLKAIITYLFSERWCKKRATNIFQNFLIVPLKAANFNTIVLWCKNLFTYNSPGPHISRFSSRRGTRIFDSFPVCPLRLATI
jgi:hypothetical protein